MNRKLNIFIILLIALLATSGSVYASESVQPADTIANEEAKSFNIRDIILEHLSDAYDWHITVVDGKPVSIPLPVIVFSQTTGWHIFMSSALHEGKIYEGFAIAEEGKYKSKIVEINEKGEQIRPIDISITKNVLSLLFSSTLLIFIIMYVAGSYRKHGFAPKKGFVAAMEMFIMNINDDVIKPSIGKEYRHYAPYLLTLFFFIFINNLLGLIPIFPGGANVTGNIAITFVLAVCTFLIVNLKGSKEYWKEIFWPDIPLWLKFPIPLLPVIELVGIISKPFALMIRLFANMLAGHSIGLGLTALIFVTVSKGIVMNTSMTILSVIFSVFIGFVELLVAFIQAYIFTMLSAVFIGLARVEPHQKH